MGKEIHHPNTTTPSYPHTSSSTPGKVHVDLEHRGNDGKVESQTKHITSPGLIKMGEMRKDANESSSYSDSSDNSGK